MSPEPTKDQAAATESTSGPGARLKAKREAGGFSLEDVSRDTRITCSRLEALEQDDYPRVGTHTFVVGYIRKYAKWVGLNADELVRDYERAIGYEPPQDEVTTKTVSPAGSPGSRRSRHLPLLGLVVAILAVWTVASFLLPGDEPATSTSGKQPGEQGAPQESSLNQTPADDDADALGSGEVSAVEAPDAEGSGPEGGDSADGSFDESVPASPAVTENANTLDTTEPNRGLEKTNGAASASPEAQAEPTRATSLTDGRTPAAGETSLAEGEFAGAAAAEDTLTMSFSADCWVEVRDASGEVLFTRLQQAGDNLRLSGEAPFALMLGNARAVDVQVNGRSVDTNPGPNRDTMRLTVGP